VFVVINDDVVVVVVVCAASVPSSVGLFIYLIVLSFYSTAVVLVMLDRYA